MQIRGLLSPAALAAVLCLMAAATPARAAVRRAAGPVWVRLSYSSEGTFRDIVLSGSTLRFTYNAHNSLENPRDNGSMMRQAPHWTQSDLVTEQVTVPSDQVADMARVIRAAGFLRLKPIYGERHGRAYGTTLQAGFGTRVTKVVYLSGQTGGPPPKAFSAVEARLVRLVNQKCKHGLP